MQGGDACTAAIVVEVAAATQEGVPHAKAVEGHVFRDTSDLATGSADARIVRARAHAILITNNNSESKIHDTHKTASKNSQQGVSDNLS